MKNNLISVCIPTYNQTIYLKKTIDSVYAQREVDFEIIISDDSSTQEVYNLVKQYDTFTPKIKYIRNNPNLGSPQNWNYVISLANGEYIKLLHHDEWFISSQTLKKLFDIASLDINNLVFSASKSINKSIETDFYSNSKIVNKFNIEPERILLGNFIGCPSGILFHTSKKNQFDINLVWLVDVDFYIELLHNSCKLIYINEKLYTSVIDDHNLTNACLADSELLIKEYVYLFKKHILKLGFHKQIFYFYSVYKILKSSIKNSRFLLLRMLKKIYYVQ